MSLAEDVLEWEEDREWRHQQYLQRMAWYEQRAKAREAAQQERQEREPLSLDQQRQMTRSQDAANSDRSFMKMFSTRRVN